MSGDGAIASLLRDVRRRVSARAAWRAAARSAVVGLAVLIAALAAARALGPGLGARLLAALAALGGFAWVAWRLRGDAAGRDEDSLARRVGNAAPEVHSDLLSVVQLRREPEPRFSAALLEALCERTARALPRRASDVVPTSEIRRPAAWTGAFVVAAAVVGWAGREPLAMVGGWVEPPPAPTSELLLDDVTVAYRYPAYTTRPPRTVEGSDGSVIAPRGTRVVLRGRPRRPGTRAVELRGLGGGIESRLERGHFVAAWTVERAGEYRLVARLRGGRRVIEAIGHPVVVEPDEPPRVELVAPADDLEVDGQTAVPLTVRAQDDFGLRSLDLVWRTGEGVPTRVPLPMPPLAARVETTTRLELDATALGAPVTYWVEAKDNDDTSGPKSSRSRIFTVRMRRDGDRRENSLIAQQEALERALTHLADRLETAPADPGWPLLPARLEDLVRTLAAARSASTRDRFAPRDLTTTLGAMIERLDRLVRAETRGSGAALRARVIAELERDVWELDRMIAGQRVDDLMALGERLRRDRERLAERLSRLSDGDEAARREMLAELAELERRLRDLMARAAELARELPAEYLSPTAAQDRGLLSDLEEARQKLERGDLAGAREAMAALGEALDRAMAELGAGEGGQRFAARQRALAEALDEVGELAGEQREIAAGAGDVERRLGGSPQSADELADELRGRTERLRALLSDADAEALSPEDARALDDARRAAEGLDDALASRELGRALDGAQAVRDGLAGRPDPLGAPRDVAAGIAADLEAALREPSVDGAGRARLAELSKRQQAARGRASSLAQRLSQMASETPSLGEGEGAVREAAESMQRGAGAMRRAEPRASRQAAGEAAERLASLEQQLREQQRAMQGGGRGLDREPVKLPGAEAYRVPREWREEILEAMKEGAPEGYREMVRRYYRELVR